MSVVRKKQNGRSGKESARQSTKTPTDGKSGSNSDQTPEEHSINSDANTRVLPEELIDGGQREQGEAGRVAWRIRGAVDGEVYRPSLTRRHAAVEYSTESGAMVRSEAGKGDSKRAKKATMRRTTSARAD